jgi:hypothetical protein
MLSPSSEENSSESLASLC